MTSRLLQFYSFMHKLYLYTFNANGLGRYRPVTNSQSSTRPPHGSTENPDAPLTGCLPGSNGSTLSLQINRSLGSFSALRGGDGAGLRDG
jgi:hypothetical protein